MPARDAVAIILLRLLGTLEGKVPGVLDDADPEYLHDLRIAVRRSRTALKLAGDELPDGLAVRFSPGFKWLGDLTTPVRDLDVHLASLDEMSGGLVSAKYRDLGPLRAHLARRRSADYAALVAGLRSARFGWLTAEWRHALDEARGVPPDGSARSAADLSAAAIGRAWRRVIKPGSSITASSPPGRMHSLRKRCKELRYLLEFFGPMHDADPYRPAVKDLKKLQDCLGAFQDSEVQIGRLRAAAAEMAADGRAPTATLLAMGEIAGRLGERQRRARDEFADRFTALARRGPLPLPEEAHLL